MEKKEKELWLELYDIASKIEDLEPWKYFDDTNLFCYLSLKSRDIFYCCIMGNAGLHKGIAVYQNQQIHKYFELANNEYPETILINYQECITCNFLSRDETMPENLKIIKELGLKFRGTWISFERFKKGYEPSYIDINQVEIMIETLNNFYIMFKEVIENRVKVDFDNDEILTRFYDPDSKEYVNFTQKLMVPKRTYKTFEVNNDIKKILTKLSKSNTEIEYEFLNYIPIRITKNKEKDGRYRYPLLRVITERKNKLVVKCDLINIKDYKNEDEYIKESIDVLVNLFKKIGLPKVVYVRDTESYEILKDLFSKTKVKLEISNRLEMIDEVENQFPIFR